MAWRSLLLLMLVGRALSELCPGGKVKCQDRMTCCPLANHDYGCCTYPDAQCCNDHVHCCPNGMQCDTLHQACRKGGFPVLFFSQTTVSAEPVDETETEQNQNQMEDTLDDSQKCPDGHECPSTFTCCKMYRGSYGCCPYSSAKCCNDGFHCCPHGSECNPETGGCQNGRNWVGMAASLMRGKKPKPSTPKTVPLRDPGGKCPDGHPCLEKYTCCKVQNGGFGCCPYTDAVCCTDLIHCCPKNTNCNNTKGTCDVGKDYSIPLHSIRLPQGSPVTPPTTPAAAATPAGGGSEVMCADLRSKCSSGNSCCPTRDGSFACCPHEEGECCSENNTCCPRGYQCAERGKCAKVSSLLGRPFLPRVLKKQEQGTTTAPSTEGVMAEYVHCPDGTLCQDEATCCQVSNNQFGCCPMPKATCCGDMKHCCPHGTWCAEGACERLQQGATNTSLTITAFTFIASP